MSFSVFVVMFSENCKEMILFYSMSVLFFFKLHKKLYHFNVKLKDKAQKTLIFIKNLMWIS
jgi:hypothetical protein